MSMFNLIYIKYRQKLQKIIIYGFEDFCFSP